jgi:hypothetical protein
MGIPTDDEELRAMQRAVLEHGSRAAAARALGIPVTTLKGRLGAAERAGIKAEKDEAIELPGFLHGDEEEPIDEILYRLRKANERKQKAINARTWFPIKVKEDKPYGFLIFGDPHLGVNCRWDLLERHIAIARQPGVYAGNIGDATDSWPWSGRMAKLWAENDISHKTERRLAKWFMFEAGISWLIFLLGNHDQWNNAEFYKELGANYVPVIDWRAQFRLIHKSGKEVRIDASHGRKGSSIYNPTHGTLRDAKFGELADIFLTGHTHNFGLFDIEFPEKKAHAWLAQVSGYKLGGLYETTNGFAQSNRGAAVLAVIDPQTGKTQLFADVEEGAEFLAWRRR